MAHYLITRLSAIGDVAMAVPLVYAIAQENPEHNFTFLTQPHLTALLSNPPRNLEAMAIDIKREEKSVFGLIRYADRLRREKFDAVIDLHNVLRTRVLRYYLRLCGVSIKSIKKPRSARKKLIAPPHKKVIDKLPHMLELEREIFANFGLHIPKDIRPIDIPEETSRELLVLHPPLNAFLQGGTWIGIAPFASTEAKTYSLDLMEQVVASLSQDSNLRILLFGGRGKESELLELWQKKYPRVYSLAGQFDLSEEIILISRLKCMLSMDSANAHFASMVGVRTVTLWCSTHPYAGFLGLGQRLEDCLQPELSCRPCSIFGQVKHCLHGDYRCRTMLSSDLVYNHIHQIINSN